MKESSPVSVREMILQIRVLQVRNDINIRLRFGGNPASTNILLQCCGTTVNVIVHKFVASEKYCLNNWHKHSRETFMLCIRFILHFRCKYNM